MATVIQTGDVVNFGDGARMAPFVQKLDLYRPTPLASPCKKDNSPLQGIKTTIQNLLTDIQNYDTVAELFGGGDSDREKFIQNLLDIASGDIAGYMKTIFQSVRGYVFNYFNEEAKKRLPFLFPSEVPQFTKTTNEGTNLISCLFNKLTRQLPNLIQQLLRDLLNNLINIPLCFIENLILDFLQNSGILDQITSVVQQALSLFSQAFDILNQVGNFLLDAIDFITGILNFFKCDDDADCPQVSQTNLAGELFSKSSNLTFNPTSFSGPSLI